MEILSMLLELYKKQKEEDKGYFYILQNREKLLNAVNFKRKIKTSRKAEINEFKLRYG